MGSSNEFNFHLATQLLLDIANEQSVDRVLQRLMEISIAQPKIACVQFWMIEHGDRCASCQLQHGCPDQSHCLHLVLGKAKSAMCLRNGTSRFEDLTTRIPLDSSPLGSVILRGEQKASRDLHEDLLPSEVADWMREAGVRSYIVTPLRFKGEVLGAWVALGHDDLPEESRRWGRILADHLGAAIANARAFQEIQRLKAQLELQNTYLQEEVVEAKAFGDLVGHSAALRHIVSQIDLVAPTEASVLIFGETGTGKELVAHEIHRRSRRNKGPLVRVNCASIPRDLFESEFFGHVRGAFTGAVKERVGRFETADRGTIFLDEVGEIPLETQNKLLRVLQEKRYERVGDDWTRQADVRIVAATNKDLKRAVAAGKFREDLYYRLNVFPIEVPPLRGRIDDIPLLASHFVKVSAKELKCAEPRLTRAAVAKLQRYSWPGNVRELRNMIERAVILARGRALDFDLPEIPSDALHNSAPRSQSPHSHPEHPKLLTEYEFRRRERENVIRVLESVNWKIKGPSGAAEFLGIKPTTLITRMAVWGLKKPKTENS